jgi:uncharacterized protein YjbI with pentapeptide repeats/nucleoside diphosphate kinase
MLEPIRASNHPATNTYDLSGEIIKDYPLLLGKIASNQNIKTLNLSGCGIESIDELLQVIIDHKSLQTIDLSDNPFTLSEAQYNALARNTTITEFKSSFHKLSHYHHTCIQLYLTWLERNRCLQRIVNKQSHQFILRGWSLNNFNMSTVCQLFRIYDVHHLTEIDLSNCELSINDELAHDLCELIEDNKSLRVFNIANNRLVGNAENILSHALRKSTIEIIIIYGPRAATSLSEQLYKKYGEKNPVMLSSEDTNFYANLKVRYNTWAADTRDDIRAKHYFYLIDKRNYRKDKLINLDNKNFSYLTFNHKVVHVDSGGESGGSHPVNYTLNVEGNFLTLNGANFSHTSLIQSYFRNVSMQSASLYQANVNQVNWFEVDLTHADCRFAMFENAKLKLIKMHRVDARGASFSRSLLTKAELSEGNLAYANFSGAKLCDANFSGANLTGAIFTNANCRNANFCGADLRSAIGLEDADLENAIFYGAKLPENLLHQAGGSYTAAHISKDIPESHPLSNIFKILANNHLLNFTSLDAKQLKLLYTLGIEYKVTKHFVKKYAPFIKLACRKMVYQKYLSKFYPFPNDIVTIVLKQMENTLPTQAFINKQAITKSTHTDFFRLKYYHENNISLLLIKPGYHQFFPQIITELNSSNLHIIAIKTVQLSIKQIKQLYPKLEKQYFYQSMINYLTSGNSLIAVIAGNPSALLECKIHLRLMLKPNIAKQALQDINTHKPALCKADMQSSYELRHFCEAYEDMFTVLHCSDPDDSENEIKLFFDKSEYESKPFAAKEKVKLIIDILQGKKYNEQPQKSQGVKQHALSKTGIQKSLVIIKPEGMVYINTILSALNSFNIRILAAKVQMISKKSLINLYSKHNSRYFFEALIEYMRDKRVLILGVSGEHAHLVKCREQLTLLLTPKITSKAPQQLETLYKPSKNIAPEIDPEAFKTEYGLIFDFMHCSDDGEGIKELPQFFQPSDLSEEPLSDKQRIALVENLVVDKNTMRTELAFRQN